MLLNSFNRERVEELLREEINRKNENFQTG